MGAKKATVKNTPGWKLRRWRSLRDLTQAQAGALFGVSQPTWSQYELGAREPEDESVRHEIRARTGVRW